MVLRRIGIRMGFFVVAPWLTGCSWFFGDDEPEEPVQKDPAAEAQQQEAAEKDPVNNVKPATLEELELKLAKVWSRVDELEEENYRHKERIRVLEKGMMLGLVPEELKKPLPLKKPPPPPPPPPALKPDPAPAKSKPQQMTDQERERYQELLAGAHDNFRAGRYGRAIKDYAAIGSEFGTKTEDGMHKYWIARSWANLKEYSMAHQRYVEFLTEYPASPWIARARLDMGRLELKQGLRETAIRRFREIIKDYPYEDAAEMARMELSNLESSL